MNALFNYVNALMPLSEKLAAHLAQTLKDKGSQKERISAEGRPGKPIYIFH